MNLVTITQIAALLGVHKSVVSRRIAARGFVAVATVGAAKLYARGVVAKLRPKTVGRPRKKAL